MIVLDLGRIRTAHERFEQVYPPEALELTGDDVQVVRPVSLSFDIYKDKRQFRLAGRVESTLALRCGRCLDPLEFPVDVPFDLRYHPRTADTGAEEKEIQEDDLATAFYDQDEIDLRQLMVEQFYLALPMKPLCDELCRGLCPVCGTNQNRGTCDCNRQWEDPRFAALRALKKES
jgi:uncharacterized protein